MGAGMRAAWGGIHGIWGMVNPSMVCTCITYDTYCPHVYACWLRQGLTLTLTLTLTLRIKEAMESRVETEVEDSIGFKSDLGKFTAPRAKSSQEPLLESADDWKVQVDVNDEGVSVKERALVPMVSSGPCRQRQ